MGTRNSAAMVRPTPQQVHLTSARLSAMSRGDSKSRTTRLLNDVLNLPSLVVWSLRLLAIWGLYILISNHFYFLESELLESSASRAQSAKGDNLKP